jgi:UDP:flavonoid glycosyltransferase YjiC (YdhE family)
MARNSSAGRTCAGPRIPLYRHSSENGAPPLPLGPSLEPDALGAVPPNVTVVAAAPHAEVLKQAALVVTHAGHGTIIKSLAAGVPVVALPMGRDQPDNAARMVATGAGVSLKPSANVEAIRAAVGDVLETPSYTAAAGRLAAAMAAEGETDRALAELEAMASRHDAARGVPL